MDPKLHLSVLWRFRFLVAIGLLIGILLALLAYVRLSYEDGKLRLSYRQQETWASHATLFVTQKGFPWGRSVPEAVTLPPESDVASTTPVPRFAEPSRFSTLAVVYARLASSDAVKDILLQSGPVDGQIEAVALATRDNGFAPLIDVAGVSDTKPGALALTNRAVNGLVRYVRARQDANAIPPEERVMVTLVDRPGEPELVQGRKLTKSIIVFLAAGLVTVGLVYLLESVRPRAHRLRKTAADGVSAPPV